MDKIITLFFSIKGQTIGPHMKIVNQEKGNCQIVAEYIQEETQCDLFEIKADKEYSKDHMTLIKEAKLELKKDILVPVKDYVDDFDAYNKVFLVYPNWWNTIPMVLKTFLKHYDWNGKTIIPVCTNEGSGLGESVSDIKKYALHASVEEGVSFIGSQVKDQEEAIKEWIHAEVKA